MEKNAKSWIADVSSNAAINNGAASPHPGGVDFKLIFDAAPALIAVHEGPDHIYIYSNPPYDRAVGRRPLLGRPLAEALSDLQGQGVPERFDEVYRAGKSITVPEFAARYRPDHDGNLTDGWFRQVLQPWHDAGGEVAGVVSFAYDVTEQVEARRAAQESEQRLEFALDAGRAFGTMVWDVQNDVVHVEGPVLPIFGIHADETKRGLPATAYIDKIHAEDRNRISDAIARALETGGEFEEEYRVTSVDGTRYWVLGRGRCQFDEAGNPTFFPAVLVDVTRLKEAEEELARNSTILRLSLESGGMGVWQFNLTDGTAILDETLKKLLGFADDRGTYSLAELRECVLPDDEQVLKSAQERAARQGVCRAEFRIVRPDGDIRWLCSRGDVHKDDRGVPHRAIGLAYDVTEQKLAHDALRQSEARFRSTFENAAVGIVYAAADGRYLMVNDQLCGFLGYARDELLGMTFLDVTHPEHLASDRENMQRLFRGEIDSYNADKRYIRKDNSTVWAHVSIGCARQADGSPDYFVGFVKDIGDRKAAEDAVRESEQRLAHERAFLDAIIEIAPVGISIARDPRSEPPILNREARRMMNVGEFKGDLQRYEQLSAVHPNGLPYEEDDYPTVRALKFGEECHGRELIYQVGGARRRWLVNSRPLRNDEGEIVAAVTAFLDVEEQRKLEEYRKLLIDELNHRVKNTLAVVQGLAQQTFKDDALSAKARLAFEGRLHALASTHELLTQENWEKTSLATVAEESLRSCDGEGRRTSHQGSSVTLSPKQAVTITMALHELCTNAVKYGALSNDSGRVDLVWETTQGQDARLHLTWRESGGPPVSMPERRGFGSRMIEQALAAELEGRVDMSFQPDGLVCTIDAPLPTDVRSQN